MKSLKNIYFSENFYIKNKIYSLNEAIITQKDFLGKLVKQIKERPAILGIIGVNTEEDIYDKLEENYSKKSDSSNKTKEYYYKLYIDNYINSKEKDDSKVDKELVDTLEDISDLGEKFNKIYERLSSKQYFEKKYREKIEKLESDRAKRVEMLSKKGIKIPANDLNPIEFDEKQFDKEWDIESRLFVVEGNIGLEIFKVVELFNLLESSDKKSEKSAEEILQKQLKKYEGLDGGSIEFREIKKLYDEIIKYINSQQEIDVGQCIECADFYLRTIYVGLDEEEKKLIDSGEFDFSEIFKRVSYFTSFSNITSSKFNIKKNCKLIYEDEKIVLYYPESSSAFNNVIKYFEGNVQWCTQKPSTWLYYNTKYFTCILHFKDSKVGDLNYLISFKIAKTDSDHFAKGEILYDDCCDYKNIHMSYDKIFDYIDSGSRLNSLKTSIDKFISEYVFNEIDIDDFINNKIDSFIKMNKKQEIFEILFEYCLTNNLYTDQIVIDILEYLYDTCKHYNKESIFYEVANKLFVNLENSLQFYFILNQNNTFEKKVINNLFNSLLSLCKISNTHCKFFIECVKVATYLSIDINWEDKYIIFNNAIKTNNDLLFNEVISTTLVRNFFKEEFNNNDYKNKIFDAIINCSYFKEYLEKNYITIFQSLVRLNKETINFSSFSFNQLIYYICIYKKQKILEIFNIEKEKIDNINKIAIIKILKDELLLEFDDKLFKSNIDYLHICCNRIEKNVINEKLNSIISLIIEKDLFFTTDSDELNFEFIKKFVINLINESLLTPKLSGELFEKFIIYDFINKIYNKETIIDFNNEKFIVYINNELIKKVFNLNFINISTSDSVLIDLSLFLDKYIEYFNINFNDLFLHGDLKNFINNYIRTLIIKNYNTTGNRNIDLFNILNKYIFSNKTNETFNILIFMFDTYNSTRFSIYEIINYIVESIIKNEDEKLFYDKFFKYCYSIKNNKINNIIENYESNNTNILNNLDENSKSYFSIIKRNTHEISSKSFGSRMLRKKTETKKENFNINLIKDYIKLLYN